MNTSMDIIRIAYVMLFWFLIKQVSAITDVQKSGIQKELVIVGIQCIKDHPLSLSDIRAFKNKMMPNGSDAKCFAACLFKKVGVMDDMGMLSPAKARENAKKVFNGNEEHLKNVDEIMEKCSAVNQQKTSDGQKGCERAKLAFGCFVENAPKAITDVQKSGIQKELVIVGIQCIKDHPLSLSDIRAFKNKMMPNGSDAKCFAACLFKKVGVMDDMGMLSPAKARENAKKVFNGNEEHLKNVDEIMEKCSAVNQQKTSDGQKGCERAKLAFGCFVENAPKFGFDFDF